VRSILALVLIAVAASTGCRDNTFRIDPLLAHDTVTVYAPLAANAGQPTALDVTAANLMLRGARFPERSADAEQWDFAVRVRDGQLVLVPASQLGLTSSRAAISPALAGETFEGLRQVPPNVLRTDSVVAMRVGQVHVARSRDLAGGFGACQQYAKLQPLEVDAAAGRLRLQITTNERCSDLRLVPED
jgi:hypothetical protein